MERDHPTIINYNHNLEFCHTIAEGTAVVEIQVILKSYLVVKKRMHAIYRVSRGDFG
jgi:hypothetical protein